MSCPSVEKLAEYLAELRPPAEQQRIAAHLDGCARCRQEITALEQTASLLKALPPPSVPDELWAGVAARIAPRPVPLLSWWATSVGVGLAACLAVALAYPHLAARALPPATATAASYVAQHQLLSAQEPFTDRASVGVVLAAERSTP